MTLLVGRYAPSPTGSLHLGNLRTALCAYVAARRQGGRFLLRVEDIDTPRVVPGMEGRQLADLQALGLAWDETPLRQSERGSVYAEAISRLDELGLVYPCFCSRRDVREALSAPHAEHGDAYPGTCRKLDPATARERIAQGAQHSLRLRVTPEPIVVKDLVAGERGYSLSAEGGDFVIRRADGLYSYQLVCAVDDLVSGITEVVRGEDLLTSAARQSALIQHLGGEAPRYAHLPLMTNERGERLSKRAGSDDLSAFLASGLDAVAVRSYLAWTLGLAELGERSPLATLCERFEWSRLPREGVRFDRDAMERFRAVASCSGAENAAP